MRLSGVGAYASFERPPADENSTCGPELLYERTNYEGEFRVGRLFQETGFPIVIIGPSRVYGAGCPRTRRLFKRVSKKRSFFVSDGTTLRHRVYVDDFVDAIKPAEGSSAPAM